MQSNDQFTRQDAKNRDQQNPLASYRDKFILPDGIYLNGNSLGPLPVMAKQLISQELEDWGKHGVQGHFKKENSWLPYHELVTKGLAKITGSTEREVVSMSSLTVNLNLMMVPFYKPTKDRYKILRLKNAFPSDKYAIHSQVEVAFDTINRYEGKKITPNVDEAIIEVGSDNSEAIVEYDAIFNILEEHGDSITLVLLEGVNYLTGQYFDIERITRAAHAKGCLIGWDLAHATGNVSLQLHDWNVDFAVGCSYKYLNAGPGGIAYAFVHENHLDNLNSLTWHKGWWGHNKSTRFRMPEKFDAIPTAEAFQMSNPPIFQLAALRASLLIYEEFSMTTFQVES